jgi:hypothetical protein
VVTQDKLPTTLAFGLHLREPGRRWFSFGRRGALTRWLSSLSAWLIRISGALAGASGTVPPGVVSQSGPGRAMPGSGYESDCTDRVCIFMPKNWSEHRGRVMAACALHMSHPP